MYGKKKLNVTVVIVLLLAYKKLEYCTFQLMGGLWDDGEDSGTLTVHEVQAGSLNTTPLFLC